jgi:hypothetical protein
MHGDGQNQSFKDEQCCGTGEKLPSAGNSQTKHLN